MLAFSILAVVFKLASIGVSAILFLLGLLLYLIGQFSSRKEEETTKHSDNITPELLFRQQIVFNRKQALVGLFFVVLFRLNIMISACQKSESSEGDGIDLKKRQRSPLSPNFYLCER
jgi:Ca2+/Na+ antiporter